MTQRQEIIERLRAVDLGGGSHESLSAIAKAVYEPAGGWTIVACEDLRDRLVRLLGGDAVQDRSITDELPDLLRKAAKGGYEGSESTVIDNIAQLIGCKSHMAYAVIAELADKVKQALSEAYTKGHLSGFDEAERWHTDQGDWLSEHEDEMAEHGWVRLPKGADGEYIHIGDKIMLPDGNVVEIIGIGGDWLYYCVASVAITVFGRIRAHDKCHYHAPTVEDTLREFARECLAYATCVEDHEVTDAIERFAAKLRLAGDVE